MTSRKWLVLGLLLTLQPVSHALAGNGGEGSGGGDLCEDRIKMVRDDLKSWIEKGGPQGLSLPAGVSVAQYSAAMLEQIQNAKIRCVSAGDSDYPVAINGTPKVCRFDSKSSGGQITCDYSKFLATDESGQYVLIHHEYAGLAGIEVPTQDNSHYATSNQISKYLQDQVVKKLAVKPVPVQAVPCDSVDLRKQKAGFVCKNSLGVEFELVEREGQGKLWAGPDQLAWSDVQGSDTLAGAQNACAKLGMSLPLEVDFQRGSLNGFREVLPNINGKKYRFWSQTTSTGSSQKLKCSSGGGVYDCLQLVTLVSYYDGTADDTKSAVFNENSMMLFRCVSPVSKN